MISLTISPTGRYIATGTEEGYNNLYLWDFQNRNLIHNFEGHFGEVTNIFFTPDEKLLVSGGGSNLKLWHMDNKKLYKTISEHSRRFPEDRIEFLGLTSDGQLMVCCYSSIIKVYDTRFWNLKLKFGNEETFDFLFTLRPLAHEIVTTKLCDQHTLLQKWSLDTGTLLATIRVPTNENINILRYALEGQFLLVHPSDQNLSLWDFESGALIRSFEDTQAITVASVSPGNRYLVTASYEGANFQRISLDVWDFKSGKHLRSL